MFRRDLLLLLEERPLTAHEIAREMECPVSEALDALRHLQKTLRHRPERLDVEPARCRKCGFTFSAEKLNRPSKCPRCHGKWISEPRIGVSAPRRG